MEKRFLGIKDCSEYLGVSVNTLYSWTWQKKIPYLKIGRLVKFDLRAIEGWLKERTIDGTNMY
ncbi:MAG: helix-turn-helix domain-containing protein [Candidatus Omnitrophica bacterium]|nr:helix-turn-helix domain-containing protein [Candidatus Omnitrophota bacterium]